MLNSYKSRTAFYLASLFGHEACMRILLDHGANYNACDCSGLTAFQRLYSCGEKGEGYKACRRLLRRWRCQVKQAQAKTSEQKFLMCLMRQRGGLIASSSDDGSMSIPAKLGFALKHGSAFRTLCSFFGEKPKTTDLLTEAYAREDCPRVLEADQKTWAEMSF